MPENTGQTYGMTLEMLNAIITETQEAIDQLQVVNTQVNATTSDLGQANQSTSGTTLTGKLSDWSTDFLRVNNALSALNEKAKNLRNINISTNSTAAGLA
ncbi:hypothetical protein KIH74_14710 [Kineosporia sp. J2-2]|uniref:Proteins of 100 residues with WXG n=1 Tax=Kineosporia corallincola TaxID=2835133 RepID=A0ABS5TIF0_9ACTN|nr:hypothetical protein [Kineosporia corallincola]MBT0770189.1 hypothetical protein [Kineosporia corallincola]